MLMIFGFGRTGQVRIALSIESVDKCSSAHQPYSDSNYSILYSGVRLRGRTLKCHDTRH